MPGGRPALFLTPEDLEAKIKEYYSKLGQPGEDPYATITGLTLYLGFESRQSFYDYEERPEFSYIIKRARLKVENTYELRLSNQNTSGAIFALKNMGWSDKQEIDQKTQHSGGIAISWQDPTLPNTEDQSSD